MCARREQAAIYWGDATGLRSDHAAGRAYGRRGRTPVVVGTGQRFGGNMISAITNRGQLSFMVDKPRFTAKVFVDFLKRRGRGSPRKGFLIVDGHPVHRSGEVNRWLEKNTRRIRIFFLPGYSPELNPDAVLNQDVKTNALGRQRPRDLRELITNVRRYLRRRQRQPHIVKRYFEEEHVRYAAA